MSDWKRQQNFKKIEKVKRGLHACGRKYFNNIILYLFPSLFFFGKKGPTEENLYPVKAGDQQKTTKIKTTITEKSKKDELDIACYSENVSSSNENTLLITGTTDNDVTDNSIISITNILFEKGHKDSSNKTKFKAKGF